jgi:hypothetical protein
VGVGDGVRVGVGEDEMGDALAEGSIEMDGWLPGMSGRTSSSTVASSAPVGMTKRARTWELLIFSLSEG